MDDVKRLKDEVYGNGRVGLKRRVERIELDLYADDATGEHGLVANVRRWRREDQRRWAQLEAMALPIKWAAGFVGTAAGAVLIDVIRGWIGA